MNLKDGIDSSEFKILILLTVICVSIIAALTILIALDKLTAEEVGGLGSAIMPVLILILTGQVAYTGSRTHLKNTLLKVTSNGDTVN